MFELTKEQTDIQKAAREFARAEFAKISKEADENETFPQKLHRDAAHLGFLGVFIEEKYNGAGLGIFENALILQEFWRIDPGCGCILLSTFGAELIQKFGSSNQKKRYLNELADGNRIFGSIADVHGIYYGFSYDIDRSGTFVINGSSDFLVNGGIADYLIIPARRERDENQDSNEFSIFILNKEEPSIRTRNIENKLGIRAANIAAIEITDYRAGADNRLGEGGKEQIDFLLNLLSIYSGAMAVGLAEGCLERAIRYSKKRYQFGHPIGAFQQVQFKIADMATQLESAKQILYNTVHEFNQGKAYQNQIEMAGFLARNAARTAAAETLQIHGGYGYMKEMEVERFYRDAQALELFGMSREEIKLSIARHYLGLV